jgi:hypothetical protein
VLPLERRLTFGEAVAVVGGVVLFLALFFDWYAAERGGSSNGISAWEALSVANVALLFVGLAPLALAALRLFDADVALPVSLELVVAAAGLAGLAVVVFRLIDVPDGVAALAPQGPFVGETGVEVGRRIGGALALLAAASIFAGGWAASEERGSPRRG